MKTAVSVPDELFDRADRLARSTGRSRSDVYSAALREYVARHAPDEVTDAINLSMNEIGDEAGLDDFGQEAARSALKLSEW